MHWLPEAASTYAADIDRIFYVILVVTGVVLVGVEAAIIYLVFRYRARDGRKGHYIEGSNKAEVIWTVTPAVFIVGLAIATHTVWPIIKDPNRFPTDALEVAVHAKQFEWNVSYPGADGELGTDDDFTTRNQLSIPANRPVIVNLTSEDVIHSFFIPAFRIKQDAIPGKSIRLWFEAIHPGEFDLACAELCGLGHYRMKGRVVVYSQEDYRTWVSEKS
jgi:cytochrome c oxidase subunit 2